MKIPKLYDKFWEFFSHFSRRNSTFKAIFFAFFDRIYDFLTVENALLESILMGFEIFYRLFQYEIQLRQCFNLIKECDAC